MNTRGLGSWDERSIYEYRGFRVFGLGVESPGVLDNVSIPVLLEDGIPIHPLGGVLETYIGVYREIEKMETN